MNQILTPKGITIGSIVSDVLTGFKGTVTVLYHSRTGIWQAHVRSNELKDGTIQEGCWFEEPQLELVDEESKFKCPDYEDTGFKFNQKVVDKISGKKGFITGFSYHIHGCTTIECRIEHEKDAEKFTGRVSFDPQDLEAVQDQIEVMPVSKRTGGPINSSVRA